VGAPVHEIDRRAEARPTRVAAGWLALAPPLTVAAFALPIAAGLAGTFAPAFGWLPAIGGNALSLDAWRELAAWPGFATSVKLTLATGIAATLVSAIVAFGFCAWASGRAWGPRAAAWLAPVLATPHSAFAIGLAFVIAPSGWIVRALFPWLTGFDVPPDVATVGHPSGAALVLGLVVKEVPYLVLMTAAALGQVRAREHVALARSMGYGASEAWIRAVLPQVWRQVRLPVLAVLAYSLSVVDVALVLGPGNPPTLAVLAVRWFADADVRLWFPAAAAATLVLLLVAASIAAWLALERIVAAAGLRIVEGGRRRTPLTVASVASAGLVVALGALACASLASMALWSLATQGGFPRRSRPASRPADGRGGRGSSPRPHGTRSRSGRSRRSSRSRSRSRASRPSSAGAARARRPASRSSTFRSSCRRSRSCSARRCCSCAPASTARSRRSRGRTWSTCFPTCSCRSPTRGVRSTRGTPAPRRASARRRHACSSR